MPSPVRKSDITRMIRAVRAGGAEAFDLSFDERGLPVIRVRPAPPAASNDDDAAEIERWSRAQEKG